MIGATEVFARVQEQHGAGWAQRSRHRHQRAVGGAGVSPADNAGIWRARRTGCAATSLSPLSIDVHSKTHYSAAALRKWRNW